MQELNGKSYHIKFNFLQFTTCGPETYTYMHIYITHHLFVNNISLYDVLPQGKGKLN